MKAYEVSYKNISGKKVKALFEFKDIDALDSFCQRHGLHCTGSKVISQKKFNIQINQAQSISDAEIIELVNHLHMIVKSALPLHHSLEDLAIETNNNKLRNIMLGISVSIENGNSLSSSLQPFNKLFGRSTIYLIRIGEETGTLAQTLGKAKDFLTQTQELKTKVRLALIYPVTVLTVALAAIILWFTFVLPQMVSMFESMDLQLPFMTQVLIIISDVISQSYLYVVTLLSIFIFVIYKAQKSSFSLRKKLHQRFLSLPLIGKILRNLNVAYITEFLHLSLSTGTSLFKAIQLIGDNMSNIVYQTSMKNVAMHLENGLSLSAAFEKEKIYNSFTIRMIKAGEQSGDLESQLYTIAHYYSDNVDNATTRMTKLIEPGMIIFVGMTFAFIMLGLMGPIFDIVATI